MTGLGRHSGVPAPEPEENFKVVVFLYGSPPVVLGFEESEDAADAMIRWQNLVLADNPPKVVVFEKSTIPNVFLFERIVAMVAEKMDKKWAELNKLQQKVAEKELREKLDDDSQDWRHGGRRHRDDDERDGE